MDLNIESLLKEFKIKGKLVNISCNNTGNINRTYIVTMKNNNKIYKYVLQRI